MDNRHDIRDGLFLNSVKHKEGGEHLFLINLPGQQVHASPFLLPPVVRTADFYTSLKTRVQTITGIYRPQCIAFNGIGDMFATSYWDHCVYVYDSSGRRKATIGKAGKGDLEFYYPWGIAISRDILYVVDSI